MNTTFQLVSTEDGSNSIINTQIGEQYHSKHGALQESQHVFVTAGLAFAHENFPSQAIHVLEVGFGTGLNYLNSLTYAKSKDFTLQYTGIEAFPLPLEWVEKTEYSHFITPELWNDFLMQYQNSDMQTHEKNGLELAKCELLAFETHQKYHVLYYDAFSAHAQPEMWEEEAIAHACSFLLPKGIFVTYAITGNLKRMLKSLGFEIQKLPGAKGKREMLRAIKK